MMLTTALAWFIAAVAVEGLVEIVVASDITDKLIRGPLAKKLFPPDKPVIDPPWWHLPGTLLHKMLNCGYCSSVWVAIIFAIPLELPLIETGLINYAIRVFALHRLSNLLHVVYQIIWRGRVRSYEVTHGGTVSLESRTSTAEKPAKNPTY